MDVSRSGYYKYLISNHDGKIDPDFELIAKVRQIFSRSKGSYGSRRISKQLQNEGFSIGRYRTRSLMKKADVAVVRRKKFRHTTDSNHTLPVAPNLLDRKFDAPRPNTVWCADITYIWTVKGWQYLAVIIDLYSRKVVGWAIDRWIKVSLVKEALLMAYWHRKPKRGLVHHSDRGIQYASHEYQELLKTCGMVCSMSRKGNCWDNAVVESFFHSLKTERTNCLIYRSGDEARLDVLDYIEMFYNSHRLHSFLGYKSPNNFENNFIQSIAA